MKQTYEKYNCLNCKLDYQVFVAMRLFTTLCVFLLTLLIPYGYVIAPFISVIYFLFFEFLFLDVPLLRRKNKLESEAPLFFTIVILHLEENKNIKKAIESACLVTDSYLAKEMQKVTNASSIGLSLSKTMEKMIAKCPSEHMQRILLCLSEEHRTGNDLLSFLKKEVEQLEDKNHNKKVRKKKAIFYKQGIYTLLICISMFFLYLLFTLF